MIAFTILGVLMFWCWCFQIGYGLGYCAMVGPVLLRILILQRRIARDIRAFAGQFGEVAS